MSIEDTNLTRRNVLALGAALASQGLWIGSPSAASADRSIDRVPTRPFGRNGEHVSILGLGGYFDASKNQELLATALQRGVTYWEMTLAKGAAGYGEYFRSNPKHREKVFLLAKARTATSEDMDRRLSRVLDEANTSYVDFFIVQGVSDPEILTPALRRWIQGQKAAGRIRYFGFSTHANMAQCMLRAASLGWLDGIVTAYNYRLMERPEIREAVDACAHAGISLTAIKTQALPSNPAADIGRETQSSSALIQQLADGDFDRAQTNLRAVWANSQISSILSLMGDAQTLEANCDAACVPEKLSDHARETLSHYARATSRSYCAGCASICESRVGVETAVPINGVMRLMMYADGYADLERARSAFATLPPATRRAIVESDYSAAEHACPQGIEIGRLMREASSRLG